MQAQQNITTIFFDRFHPRDGKSGFEELSEYLDKIVDGVFVCHQLASSHFTFKCSIVQVNPAQILAIWQGGMSFHGGFLGVLVAMGLCARKWQRSWLDITDFIAPLVPLGLAAGRIGNFINGELWGRVADPSLPWAMVFPRVDDLPRHPSQLYQAGMEGVMLFVVLWIYSGKTRPRGAVSGVFLIGYGVFRFLAEFFRTPDDGIFGLSEVISMGQWLSLPMILIGVLMLISAHRRSV